MHAVWDRGQIVAGAGAFPFVLTVPGGRIPAAGVTLVGVLPTHRRRGLLRAMMRAQLDACRNRGEPVAYLWASEGSIYARFGYGIASFAGEIEVPRDRSTFHTRLASSLGARLVTLEDAEPIVAPVYERVAVRTPGMFARTSAWWQARALADPDWRRQGGGDLQCVVIESRDAPVAYALFRLNSSFERGIQTGVVSVVEAIGESPEATCAIWRYLLDIDWFARLRAVNLPLDHPVLLLAVEPRRLRFNVRDGLWVRLVDVAAALSARSYTGDEPVVIEIADAFCPWNEGRWRVGKGVVERTADEADLRCDVTAVGSVYLGGFGWAQLARALRVEELRAGAIRRADLLFRSDPGPWCPEIF
jgi:predicted acetyltransferase